MVMATPAYLGAAIPDHWDTNSNPTYKLYFGGEPCEGLAFFVGRGGAKIWHSFCDWRSREKLSAAHSKQRTKKTVHKRGRSGKTLYLFIFLTNKN